MRNLLNLTKEDRKAAMDGLLRFADNLSEEERASLMTVLQSAARPPGT
jgi:acetyl-CoA carboxylase/biotin carboxylase 1